MSHSNEISDKTHDEMTFPQSFPLPAFSHKIPLFSRGILHSSPRISLVENGPCDIPPYHQSMRREQDRIKTLWWLAYFWVSFSFFLASFSTFSYLQPEWLVKRERWLILGNASSSESARESENLPLINKENEAPWRTVLVTTFTMNGLGYCKQDDDLFVNCSLHSEPGWGFHLFWEVLNIFGSLGCLLLSLSSVLSLFSVALPSSFLRYEAAKRVGKAQLVSVILLLTTTAVFPVGFGSSTTKAGCGRTAGIYGVGECEVGWAFALLVVTSALGLYLPVLAHLSFRHRLPVLPLPKHL